MNLHRVTFVTALTLLAGCSKTSTMPAVVDSQPATSATSVRRSDKAFSTNGIGFGSGTITTAPTVDSSVSDSTQTEIARGPNGFGSGT